MLAPILPSPIIAGSMYFSSRRPCLGARIRPDRFNEGNSSNVSKSKEITYLVIISSDDVRAYVLVIEPLNH